MELEQIRDLASRGFRPKEICQQLKLSRNALTYRLRLLGIKFSSRQVRHCIGCGKVCAVRHNPDCKLNEIIDSMLLSGCSTEAVLARTGLSRDALYQRTSRMRRNENLHCQQQ